MYLVLQVKPGRSTILKVAPVESASGKRGLMHDVSKTEFYLEQANVKDVQTDGPLRCRDQSAGVSP
jgi:hypothetical protein